MTIAGGSAKIKCGYTCTLILSPRESTHLHTQILQLHVLCMSYISNAKWGAACSSVVDVIT